MTPSDVSGAAAGAKAEAAQLEILSGNEAIARGAWEAGVTVAAAYPGTPSTEILENIAAYDDVLRRVGAQREGGARGGHRARPSPARAPWRP